MPEFDGECSARHLKNKFWCFSVKNCKNSAVKHSIKKPVLLKFVNLSTKIAWGNRFSLLTQSRPLDFKFFEDFSMSKDAFALQIDN